MAITKQVFPQEFQSAYNEVMVVLDSTNKSEPKFQYVIDINVNGSNASRIKVQSNPQGFGVFNISKHLEPYVGSDIDVDNLDIFKDIENSYNNYDLDFSEEYVLTTSFISVADDGNGFCEYTYATDHNFINEDFVTVSNSTVSAYDGVQEVTSVPTSTTIVTTKPYSATATGNTVLSNGTTTIIPDSEIFNTRYVMNNVLKWRDVNSWFGESYYVTDKNVGKFLTNVPSKMITRLDDRFTFNFINITEAITETFLKVITSDGDIYYFDNNSSGNYMSSVSVGAYDLTNGSVDLSIPQSALPIIKDTTTSYEVCLVDSSLVRKSEIKTFEIDRSCSDYEIYKLMYLNTGGSFTTFNFELAHSKNVSVRKKNYQKNYGSYNATTNTYGWTEADRGTTRLDTDITENYTINSNYIKEAYGNLIEDLVISPEVYHLDNGVLRSIDVQTNSVKIKQRKVEKLINYSLSFTYSNKNTVQR